MNTIKRLKEFGLIVLFLLTFSCITENSKKNPNAISIFHDNVEGILDTIIPKIQSEYIVPAVGIGLIENGKLKFIEVYGEHQKGNPAPKNIIFNVASITKPVVALTTLKLVLNGNWDLDEPLYHYWVDPDIKNDTLYK